VAGDKVRNGNQWTEARFKSFVKGGLRQISIKWGPINEAKKDARVARGLYRCALCENDVPATVRRATADGRERRVSNVHVDHIQPVIDPDKGFESWDLLIERLFCEKDGLRVLCYDCHEAVTNGEKEIAKARRVREKLNNNNDKEEI